jgi:hypothetical protein
MNLRILIALCIGLIIFFISCIVAWNNTGWDFYNTRLYYHWTTVDLRDIDVAIKEHIKETGSPPQSLKEIRVASTKTYPPRRHAIRNEDGVLVDGWRQPYLYFTDGTDYTVMSYGRDGNQDGTGLDSDLSNKNYRPPGYDSEDNKHPTLKQYFFELPTEKILLTCIISGILASVLSFLTIDPSGLRNRRVLFLLVKILIITIATLVLSILISAIHVPSGH